MRAIGGRLGGVIRRDLDVVIGRDLDVEAGVCEARLEQREGGTDGRVELACDAATLLHGAEGGEAVKMPGRSGVW